jgi:hypothetical protein
MVQSEENFPTLVAQAGPLNGQRWPINASTIIGRETDCDIIIPSRQVSRFHARLSYAEDGIILEDLASKNGTHVNGKLLVDPVKLEDGDIIQIALAQQFIYVSTDATLPLDATPIEEMIKAGVYRLRLEKRSRRVWVMENEILPPLSVSQFKLLEILYEHQGRVVGREMLIQTIWGDEFAVGVSEQALDALIRRLRDRLAALDSTHNYIVTVRGHGLRLENPSTNSFS